MPKLAFDAEMHEVAGIDLSFARASRLLSHFCDLLTSAMVKP